ncbi:MAG: hypothetical protein NC389_09700 [Acetatifactor muris]|nr:hypothetical protein [Acetatifactor muris]
MLDCIATCRCMDKKPYGNTLKDFTIKKLLPNGIVAEALRGGDIMKSETLFNRPADTYISDKNAGSVEDSGFDATVTPVSSKSLLSEACSPAFSAITAVYNKQGKLLCPSARQLAPNNRVNSMKLRCTKTDNIEPSHLSHFYLVGRCNA